ncbi:MAG: single-stranded DNA-binding protein [Leifsonia sp.]
MSDIITLTGIVASEPEPGVLPNGIPRVKFRLASGQRRFDRGTGQWVDGETNWYTVQAYRQLAGNAERSLRKGNSVIVVGKLKVRRWTTESASGTSVDVDAEAIGHNLQWGSATFERSATRAEASAADASADAWGTPGVTGATGPSLSGGEAEPTAAPDPAADGADDDIPF